MKKYLILIFLVIFLAFIFMGTSMATEKISKNKNNGNANDASYSYSHAVSADGRYVVFASDANDMINNDTNGKTDVFVRDTVTKKTQRVNYKKDGTPPTSQCFMPTISDNGRYVAYVANGDLGFNAGYYQVYLYDRSTQSTELVSQNTKQQPGSGDISPNSYYPSISADGRYVAFQSAATNLLDPNYESGVDTFGYSDIFVRDRTLGITKRISLSSTGTQANGNSIYPSISADGRYIAFQSSASNLVSGDINGKLDIFVRDIWTSNTKRIMGLSNTETNGNSFWSSISGNGRYVVFYSEATNLIANDLNTKRDVFVADMFTPGNPNVKIVSVSSSEIQGNGDSGYDESVYEDIGYSAISDDGRYVAFESFASNLVSGDTNGKRDVFVRDMAAGLTKRISVSNTGIEGNYDSAYLSLSANGKYVVFKSQASNLVSGDTANWDIFINTVDFTGPVVKSVNPKNNAKKIKRSSNLIVTFNENIQLVSSAKIYLKNKKGKIIAATKTISGNKLIINPSGKLAKNTRYYIYILAGAVSDFANDINLNTKKYTYTFTTGIK